jgi:hypothetical protein
VIIPINNVGEHGVIVDRQPHELPANAWSFAQNMRFRDGFAEKFTGHVAPFGAPTVAPYWALPVETPTTFLWLYAGLLKVYAWDGATHTDITRIAGNYGASADVNWTGDVLGGIPVINNGVDDPQMWNPANTSTKLILLSNWPASTKANALRAFKQYLVALDVTKAGTRYPQMVKWSHPAAPGTVPSSWDPADTTKDAGEYELKDTTDFCLDCFPLRDVNIIYKENTAHLMQFIGGLNIFRFARILGAAGALSRRCAAEYLAGRHVVFGDGDIYTHDGFNAQSLVTGRLRRRIYSAIDPTYYQRSFLVFNQLGREVWFCFPETGNTLPSLAAVWNYESNTWGFREIPLLAHAALGVVNPGGSSDQWDLAVGSWDSDTLVWDQRQYNPSQRSVLLEQPSGPALFQADQSSQFNAVNMTVILERQSLALPLVPEGPPDMAHVKQVSRLWPRITGTAGGVVQVYVGAQMAVNQAPTYQAPQNYVIGTTQHIDALAVGRLLALKFVSSAALDWRIHGYEVDSYVRGDS